MAKVCNDAADWQRVPVQFISYGCPLLFLPYHGDAMALYNPAVGG